ncbi:MAG: hypothetical protein MUF00_06500 [Gemmatimonadaceae bacterium]|nr:hypothetical protein [Gemmatimonadaceae bacterium]
MTRNLWRRAALLAGVIGLSVFAGCREELEGGAGCPLLCSSEAAVLRDTVLEAIEFDTTLTGFPLAGLNASVLVATRGDSLVTRGVFRFDLLPRTFAVNNSATTDSIRAVDSTFLVFRLDSSGARGSAPVTIEAYDVDTTDSDSVRAVVASLFRPSRLLGSRTVPRDSLRDSLRLRLADSLVARKISGGQRLRVGLAVRSTDGAQMVVSALVAGGTGMRLQFDPRGDTIYAPTQVQLTSLTPEDNVDFANAYQAYTLPVTGTAAPARDEWAVGGIPGRRAYLRFRIPRNIQDSSTIVRAQLLLTQRPSRAVDGGRGVTLVGYIGSATTAVTDLARAAALASVGQDQQTGVLLIDTLRVLPADSGVRTISVVSVVRAWASLDSTVTRAIIFGTNSEGISGQELRFASTRAPLAQRPRLRITYQPRREFGLP